MYYLRRLLMEHLVNFLNTAGKTLIRMINHLFSNETWKALAKIMLFIALCFFVFFCAFISYIFLESLLTDSKSMLKLITKDGWIPVAIVLFVIVGSAVSLKLFMLLSPQEKKESSVESHRDS